MRERARASCVLLACFYACIHTPTPLQDERSNEVPQQHAEPRSAAQEEAAQNAAPLLGI